MAEVQQFAPGANNAAALVPFFMLNPPLFKDYTREIKQRWQGYAGKAANGNLLSKTWGAPQVTLTFGRLTRAEFAYLVTLIGECTVYCRNEDTNTFRNYNAKLQQVTAGDFNKSANAYDSVTAEFVELIAL